MEYIIGLIDEMSSPKRKKFSQRAYEKRYDELKVIHKFSFRKRKKFTRSQKSAITRLYKQYRYVLNALGEGRGIFKKTTKAQNRALKKARVKEEGFRITNKGIIFPGLRLEKVESGKQRVRISGKGKKIRITVTLPAKREMFIPYLRENNETFAEFVERMIEKWRPDDIIIQNDLGSGKWRYEPKTFLYYVNREIQPKIDDIDSRYGASVNVFTGIWLIWYRSKRVY